jgi:hypothetical protein
MTNAGASNIGPSGFTIDLQKIDTISLSRGQKTVSIGPGASWKMVYHALEPYNLTAAGGRTSNVGVAGFLLGGERIQSIASLILIGDVQAVFRSCLLSTASAATTWLHTRSYSLMDPSALQPRTRIEIYIGLSNMDPRISGSLRASTCRRSR